MESEIIVRHIANSALAGQEQRFKKPVVTIGRDAGTDIAFDPDEDLIVSHNHAELYDPKFNPPAGKDSSTGFASGAWFIGPDGSTLAQMPPSDKKEDSKEFMLVYNIPIGKK